MRKRKKIQQEMRHCIALYSTKIHIFTIHEPKVHKTTHRAKRKMFIVYFWNGPTKSSKKLENKHCKNEKENRIEKNRFGWLYPILLFLFFLIVFLPLQSTSNSLNGRFPHCTLCVCVFVWDRVSLYFVHFMASPITPNSFLNLSI